MRKWSLGVAVAGVVAVSALAGCGAAPNGIQNKTAAQAYSAMKAAVAATSGANFSGNASEGTTKMSFSGALAMKKLSLTGLTATANSGAAVAQVWVVNDEGYLQFNQQVVSLVLPLLGSSASSSLSTEAGLLAGKCIDLGSTTSSSGSPIASIGLTSGQLLAGSAPAGVKKGAVTTVDGQSVLPLTYGTSTVYIATTGPALPVEITGKSSGTTATLTFSNWNNIGAMKAPSGCVNLKSLLGGASPSPSPAA